MDGTHDLGGKEGFGPIDVTHEYRAFETDWEGRMWALAQTTRAQKLNLDWFRHLVECLEPPAYLTMSYFEKWAMAHLTGFILSGEFTARQVIEGTSGEHKNSPVISSLKEVLAATQAKHKSFEMPAGARPMFNEGDQIHTNSHGKAGHTRLPAYLRGRRGRILAHRGAHLFADESAKGNEMGQHLYTVSFRARELWGHDASNIDTVQAELWESYFVHA